MPVVEIAVPALRRLPLIAAGWGRVPDVDVLELRPHLQVRVREVEQARVDAEPEPGIVEPELDVPRVLADDVLLPGASPQRRLAALRLSGEAGFRLGDEACGVGLELLPHGRIRHELRERQRGVSPRA